MREPAEHHTGRIQERIREILDECLVRQASADPTIVKALKKRSRQTLCSVMSAAVLVIMRVIVQTGHKSGLTTE